MELKYKENAYVDLRNEYGEVENVFINFCAKSGYGKGLGSETSLEEFHNAGYTVLCLADPKREVEMGFAEFLPEKDYHIKHLKLIGKKPNPKPVKVYHPFSLNLPKSLLPPINFYTVPIKSLTRTEWSLIVESNWDSDVLKNLLFATQSISNEDGIYSFIHYLQDRILGKSLNKKEVKIDWNNFGLKVTSGTAKSIQDISGFLKIFLNDYFLSKGNSKHNLDFRKIINDNKHYHVFTSKWIKEEKLRQFLVLYLLNQIIEHKDYAKKPIVMFFPEINKLTPFKAEGYKKFLAQGIKENMKMMRSMGSGMSAIFDCQVYTDVDEAVRNSATVSFFGEIGGASDRERIAKANNYKRDVREQLAKMEKKNSFLMTGLESEGAIRIWFPGHMHCEPKYHYVEMYKKHFPERMKYFKDLVNELRLELNTETNKIKEKVKAEQKRFKEQREREAQEKEEKSTDKEKLDKKIEKAKELADKSKEQLARLCYEMKEDDPKISYRKIGEKFGLHKDTAKKYIEFYQGILDKKEAVSYEEEILEEVTKEEKEIVDEEDEEIETERKQKKFKDSMKNIFEGDE